MAWTLRAGVILAISERAWRYWNAELVEPLEETLPRETPPLDESTHRFWDFLHHDFTSDGLVPTLLMLLLLVLDVLALAACARQGLRGKRREDLKAAETCTVHAECQTFECDFLCNRCELKSRELDKVLGELLVEQKKVSSGQTEVQESRSQLVAARERLVELGNEAREQKLQNTVQAKRLERALKEWNASETERRRSECQVRVMEQEVERLRKDLSSAAGPAAGAGPAPREATPEAPLAAPRGERPVVKRVSWPGPKNAVLDKARLLEEKMREDGRTSKPNEERRGARSPNTQMREKMAEARRRLEQKLPEADSSEAPQSLREQDSQAKVSTSSRSPSNSTASLSPRDSAPTASQQRCVRSATAP
mmetsp:Transcript_8505/g.13664  ORF Transcript_8505/g.13664 Transcript_8505/m.13664 type:complete len:366 (+) Transcript_8505:37-1134(+)